MVMSALPKRDAVEAALIESIQGGLPLVERPFAAIAASLGLAESEAIERIQALIEDGTVKRFGVIVRHRELGYRANAMVVWDLPDDSVDALGQRIGALPFVTLCYRRPRRPPDWPYNLFTMIHGRNRESVLGQVQTMACALGLGSVPREVLFSASRFKQRGALYRQGGLTECLGAGRAAVPEPAPPAESAQGRLPEGPKGAVRSQGLGAPA
jgi:DNA-binding Lrp family transcriptional regulator